MQPLDRLRRDHVGLAAADDHHRALHVLHALPQVREPALARVRLRWPRCRVPQHWVERPAVAPVLRRQHRRARAAVQLLGRRVGVEVPQQLAHLVEGLEAAARRVHAAQRLHARAQHLGRGLDRDQRGHDVGVLGREADRVRPAHAVADERHGAQPERLDDRREVLDLRRAAVVHVRRSRRPAVPALVQRDHAVFPREVDRGLFPGVGRLAVRVEQDQRVLRAYVPPLVVVETQAVRVDGLVMRAAGYGHHGPSCSVQGGGVRGQAQIVLNSHRSIAPGRPATDGPALARLPGADARGQHARRGRHAVGERQPVRPAVV